MDKHLHIISLDVPWPADYGGVVDLFYKLVWLHKLGIKIHLHCYTNGRPPQDELNKYCETVQYYDRKKFPGGFSFWLPYIVSSRSDKQLLENLSKDDYPILMEGVHCTYFLNNDSLKNRRTFVRLHNVEHQYYKKLADNESNFLKKCYFLYESWLLKGYEKSIANKATFWPVSEQDTDLYRKEFQAKNIDFLPVFLPWQEVFYHSDKGCFCLYHGNLSVNENEKAVEWLITKVFKDVSIPLVIAGKNPSAKLEHMVHQNNNCCIVSNPSDAEMQDMIKKAQVNILPSFNNTGVKLKVLNALYNGRHCLVNEAAAEGAAINGLCVIANSETDFRDAANYLYSQHFTSELSQRRTEQLEASYNNEANAKKMISWIY